MTILAAVLLGLAALAWLAAVVVHAAAGRGDAAGRGLAEPWVVGSAALAWLLAAGGFAAASCLAAPDSAPLSPRADGFVGAGAIAASIAVHLAALAWTDSGSRSRLLAALLPAPLLLHAGWRAGLLPVSAGLANATALAALLGLAAVALGAAWGHRLRVAAAGRRAERAPTPEQVHLPAVLLVEPSIALGVHDAIALRSALGHHVPPGGGALLVDRALGTFVVTHGERGPLLVRAPRDLGFEALRERLSAMPSSVADAEFRRLLRMQSDVSAVAFLLPRAPAP